MPESALPLHLLNGNTHTPKGGSPLRTSVSATERDRLTASIQSLNSGRYPIDLALLEDPESAAHQPHAPDGTQVKGLGPTVEAATRPASPYTLNPPIDFDGLSWPSEFFAVFRLFFPSPPPHLEEAATEGFFFLFLP